MGTLSNALQGGLVFWSMGIYATAFEDHFGAPRARINLIETMITIGVNLMSIFVGMWVDRRSARHLVAVGCCSLGVGLILVSLAGTLLQIWIVYLTLIPLGILALGIVPSATLISRWFRKRRGLALGLSVTGSSIGGFIAPLVITVLFTNFGWRTSLQILGVFTIILAPVFLNVLVNHPEDIGQEPEPEAKDATQVPEESWGLLEIVQTKAVWLQVLISGSLLGVTLGLLANLGFHAKDLGLDDNQRAWLYSTIAAFSFAGKIAFGGLIDRVGNKPSGALTVALMISAMLTFMWGDTFEILLLGSVVMGCAIGGVSPLWGSLVAEGFGPSNMGRTMGLQNPLHLPITAPSAPLAGYISDTTGSYDLMFMIYAGFAVIAGVSLYFLEQPKRPKNPVPLFVTRLLRKNGDQHETP